MKEKRKHKIVIGSEILLLCMIMGVLGTNAASANPPSNGVSYNKNGQVTVQNALDDLYNKANYGNASASQILKGRTALVGGKQITGTYVAPTLSSQTPGNATEADILKDKIAWVNGNKIIGTGSKSNQKLSYILKVGDYVKYVPSKETYTISGEETGYGGDMYNSAGFDFDNCKYIFTDQIIHPSRLTLWRVIKINNDGTIEAISVNASIDDVYFRYLSRVSSSKCPQNFIPIGYRNYVGVLNKIAASYETEGITIGSRHMGYDGTQQEYLTDNEFYPDEGYKTDVELVKSVFGSIGISGTYYYVASRCGVGVNGNQQYHIVKPDGSVVCDHTLGGTGWSMPVDPYFKVRPIVVFKSDAVVYGGVGTEESPWILTKSVSPWK